MGQQENGGRSPVIGPDEHDPAGRELLSGHSGPRVMVRQGPQPNLLMGERLLSPPSLVRKARAPGRERPA